MAGDGLSIFLPTNNISWEFACALFALCRMHQPMAEPAAILLQKTLFFFPPSCMGAGLVRAPCKMRHLHLLPAFLASALFHHAPLYYASILSLYHTLFP